MLDFHLFIWIPDGVPECSALRVPKIKTIFGVVGMLKLVAGNKMFLFRSKSNSLRPNSGAFSLDWIYKCKRKPGQCQFILKFLFFHQSHFEDGYSILQNYAVKYNFYSF